MLSQQILSQGISPQFLSNPNISTGTTVMVQNFPTGLKNVYTDPKTHLNVLYNKYETPYMSNINCETGTAGVDGTCICSGSPSLVPYRQNVPIYSKNYLNSLWSPIETNLFPQVSQSSQMLIAQRSQCGTNGAASCQAMYGNLDSMPINQSCGNGCY